MQKSHFTRRSFLGGLTIVAVGTVLTACQTRAPTASTPATVPAPTSPPATAAPAATSQPTAAVASSAQATAPAAAAAVASTAQPSASSSAKTANPATVNSDRVLRVGTNRSSLGKGLWGPITTSDWKFETDIFPFLEMPLTISGEANQMGSPTPWLAKSWTVAPDSRSFTVTLHPEAKWSDGQPITTEDLIYTIELCYSPDADYWLGPSTGFLPYLTGGKDFTAGKANTISGLTAVDDHTLKATFDAPGNAFPLDTMGLLSILPKHFLSKYTAKQLWNGDFPEAYNPTVYSGPYHLVRFDRQQKYLEVLRDDNWWGNAVFGQPGIKHLSEQVSNLQAALAGKIDLFGRIGVQDVEAVKQSKTLVVNANARESEGLMFNMRPGQTLPKPVKQAILLAINKQAVNELTGLGMGKPLLNPFSNVAGQQSWCPDCSVSLFAPVPYNPAQAKKLLADAKWDPNREIVIIGDPTENAILSLLQQELQAIGMKVKVNTSSTLITTWQNKGQYDIEWQGGWPANDPARFCQYWVGDPTQNAWLKATGWSDPSFTAACEAGLGSGDPNARLASFKKALQIYDEDIGPIQSLTQYVGFYAIIPNLAGFQQNQADMTGLCGKLGIASWYWGK